jgi:dihydrofolate reductase
MQDFAEMWQAADKVVYSRALASVPSARTRIERDFDPGTVRQLKASAGCDLTVGGRELAALAMKAGLVDERHLIVTPIVVGGKQSLPRHVGHGVELMDERCFGNGMVYLRYRTRT